MYAEIIIPLALPKNYTWFIPGNLLGSVQPGCRVEVNLGKNKKYAGVVKNIFPDKPEFFEPKEILNILDESPVVTSAQLKLWEWMAAYYMCSEGEVMAAALPAHFKLSSETIVIYNEEYGEDFTALDNEEFIVAEALLVKKELKLTEVQQLLDNDRGSVSSRQAYPVINRLIGKKVAIVWETLKQTYSPKKETFVLLNPAYDNEDKLAELLNNWSRAPKQLELLLSYLHLQRTEGEVTKTSLLKKSGASDAQLKGLVEKQVLRTEKRNVDRVQYLPRDIFMDFELTPVQQKAYDEIGSAFDQKPVCLLYGITSSGKTNIYIKLIEEFLRKGKQVLYLLPEIALTSQIIRRLQKHFGGYIGIYHSKFSQNERVETWNKVRTGELKIILGARSSVFLPFNDLGLLICDEEHDTSYKQQDPAPRYNGRDAGIFLAALFSARSLLGSGTPSLESYHNAETGKYALVELMQRYGDVQLPLIELVDTRKFYIQPTTSNQQPATSNQQPTTSNQQPATSNQQPAPRHSKIILSPPIIEAINKVLRSKRQVILFQNRRGYSPYQVCLVCGWIPQCRYCDVSLTYHKMKDRLICHYCGSTYPLVTFCAACGSHNFAQRNFGTEKIEELLMEQFPSARIARMDVDTVRGKHAHDALIQLFEQQRIDLLVGTQMVVKGLDFDHVDLVGILDADGLLHFADFRVNERAFQLMEQVSGRAGRKPVMNKEGKLAEPGLVLIQTSNPTHPVLKFVQDHDYKKMYMEELEKRKQFFYPPFSRIIHLQFRHKMKDIVERAALFFTNHLRNRYENYLVGPAEPVINRVRNQYLQELLIKLPRDKKIVEQCKADILFEIARLHQERSFKSVTVIPDVDAL